MRAILVVMALASRLSASACAARGTTQRVCACATVWCGVCVTDEDLETSYLELWNTVIKPFNAAIVSASTSVDDAAGDAALLLEGQGQGHSGRLFTWARHVIFLLGSFFGVHRIRVLKYTAMLTTQELAIVRKCVRHPKSQLLSRCPLPSHSPLRPPVRVFP